MVQRWYNRGEIVAIRTMVVVIVLSIPTQQDHLPVHQNQVIMLEQSLGAGIETSTWFFAIDTTSIEGHIVIFKVNGAVYVAPSLTFVGLGKNARVQGIGRILHRVGTNWLCRVWVGLRDDFF